MKVTLVPASVSPGEGQGSYLTSYLIDGTLAVDAGSLGFYLEPHDQARVRHVLLSHSHIDHLASLPVFVENAYEGRSDCVVIHGSEAVLDCLRRDIFNDRVWPDFLRLSTEAAPFLRLSPLEAGQPVDLEGLRVTPIPVNHIVPTFGFIIEGKEAAIVISSDTGPTEALWERANEVANLKAVFLEVAFPNAMAWLAGVSKHLTPALFGQEVAKLGQRVPVFAVHIKRRYQAQVVAELKALGLPEVRPGEAGTTYEF